MPDNEATTRPVCRCARVINHVGVNYQQDAYRSERCWRFHECYANESFAIASVRPIGRWLANLRIQPVGLKGKLGGMELLTGPTDETTATMPVCYSGFFAGSRAAIRRTSRYTYERLRDEVSVGDSLETGHFIERSWPSLFKVSSEQFSARYVRLAILVSACPGESPLPLEWAQLPLEADRILGFRAMWVRVGYWPGDICVNLTCSRNGNSYPIDTHLWEPPAGANPVTDFVVLSPGGTTEVKSMADPWQRWKSRRVPSDVCRSSMAVMAGLAPPLASYSAFFPRRAVSINITQAFSGVMDAVNGRLSTIGGPSVVILAKWAAVVDSLCGARGDGSGHTRGGTILEKHGCERRSEIKVGDLATHLGPVVAIVQRTESPFAQAFRMRWANLTRVTFGREERLRERAALITAIETFPDTVVVVPWNDK